MTPLNLLFLNELSRSFVASEAAIADNCRFDERTSPERWAKFESRLPGPDAINLGDWGEANEMNFGQTVAVPSITVPDSFLPLNQMAWLTGIAENRGVVRLESLIRPLDGMSLDDLQDLLARADSGKDPDALSTVEGFFNTWNSRRDNRPAFAAFYDEVKNEADDTDWPHALRDRLGLGHYGK